MYVHSIYINIYIYTYIYMCTCDMAHSIYKYIYIHINLYIYVWHGLFIVFPIHTARTLDQCLLWYDLFTCVTWLVHTRHDFVAVCCSVLQCVAVCCIVLQCVSVLQCVVVYSFQWIYTARTLDPCLVTWRIHMCDMTRPPAPRLLHMRWLWLVGSLKL